MRSFPCLGKGGPWGGNQPRILSGHGLQGLGKSFLERASRVLAPTRCRKALIARECVFTDELADLRSFVDTQMVYHHHLPGDHMTLALTILILVSSTPGMLDGMLPLHPRRSRKSRTQR